MNESKGPEDETGLAERLVLVALDLLADRGLEGLSLRGIARHAGVSHGAPARHFRSLADLLSEVAARGFALLSEAMEKCDASLPPDADATRRLSAAAKAYVDRALANPALFALMFRADQLDVTNASFGRESRAAFEGLLRHVRAAQAAGWHSERDARLLAGSTWASVHGLATLWAQGAYQGPIPGVSLEDALLTTLELVADRRGDTEMSENRYLSGNFAPVEEELTAFDLDVSGSIPSELEGRLLRIGPNPVAPDPKTHHWFIGNGMVHGVRLRGGKAEWYRNRYVRDGQVVAAKGWPPVEGPERDDALGDGVANTNVIGHAGTTLAIVEAGNLPVELTYELETKRRTDFDGTLPAGLTAHPHRDPDTGELHAAVYSPAWEHIQYVVVGVDGRVRRTVDVPVPGRPMVHDCMFTKSYFILLDLPVILDPEVAEAGFSLPYKWHPEYGARVGLLPREGGADDVTWHEVDPCYVFHPMNGYEDSDGRVVLNVVRHPKMFATDMQGPNEGKATLDRWLIDPKGGPVKEARLDDAGQEFPRVDDRRAGKSYRYGYTTGLGGDVSLGGIKKHDLRQGTAQLHSEGEDRAFMEPVFVPTSAGAGEDEGFVMAYVYDKSTNKSDVVIVHAQDFEAPPVATIHLPQRVPFGFHGNWVADDG